MAGTVVRARARVEGTVQGVGFRPFAYRLAGELGLAGWVLNDARGVLLEVEGAGPAVAEFLVRLRTDAPPLAVIDGVACEDVAPEGERTFEIRASPGGGRADAPVTPDSATCANCLRELSDPADRRYRYPFTNCTDCGPRFTIVRGVPYDRPLTTMAAFAMCPACRAEYEDPGDRRFHAQPNACPVCGPRVTLLDASGAPWPAAPGDAFADALAAAAGALAGGAILAVKGIGGYHLACRADDEAVVAALRARKHREDKPFALMVGSLDDAAALVELGDRASELLESAARPIVLAPRRPDAAVAGAVAPRAGELGVMLAYSPLHAVLIGDLRELGVGAVVLTSGNVSDEPIAFRDEDALDRLAGIADGFLVHDRPIETRTDDSVVREVAGRPMMLRRSRGYVPAALALPGGAPVPILGCGAELKHAFCLARGERAWVSHHIGDLRNYETLQSFTEGVAHFSELFAVSPALVAHDMHPEYLSTKYALERDGLEPVAVQHHHAHLAACLAEHGFEGPAVGAIFDGTGYGLDGTVWGGEFLYGDMRGFERVGHLLPARLPGGERAIREPWRMACAWLSLLGRDGIPPALAGAVPERTWEQVAGLARTGFQAPLTTSMGRLFDAVAALCGVRAAVTYEGQAAIELEAACAGAAGVTGVGASGHRGSGAYPVAVRDGAAGAFVLDPLDAVSYVLDDLSRGTAVARVAARFHAGIAAGTVAGCARACAERGCETVVLSGGVFANRVLSEAVLDGLAAHGLRALVPERLPVGDGGIAFGQVAVAAARVREDRAPASGPDRPRHDGGAR